MEKNVTYIPDFVKNPDEVFSILLNELDWEKRGETPRKEYYSNELNIPYVYGVGRGIREYLPKIWHEEVIKIKEKIEELTNTKFEVCFLNLYENQKDHLGWHADDSPEMDDDRPIAIVSLGVEREIWFCPQNDKSLINKVTLENGSLCVMAPGMQDTHYHRIPKANFECGKRISLTFRGYSKV